MTDDPRATVAKIEEALKALKENNRVAQRQLETKKAAKPPARKKKKKAGQAEEAVAASVGDTAAEGGGPEAEELPDPSREQLRLLEALLFAATEPLDTETLRARLPEGAEVGSLLARLQADYADRGVVLTRVAGKWRFQTAPDLAAQLNTERTEPRKLSQAARETLAIIAYHQPVTRAEVEGVRGVAVSKGTLDLLLEIGWVRPRGRRRAPGRPTVYATTDAFLEHFGLESLEDLPGKDELKAAGLLDADAPDDFEIPDPSALPLQDDLDLSEPETEEGVDAAFHTDYLQEQEKADE